MIRIFSNILIIYFVLIPFSNSYSQKKNEIRGLYLGQKPPGDIPELFAPGIISTCSQHGSAYISPDGNEIYFNKFTNGLSNVMVVKMTGGSWSNPEIVCEGLTPFLSPDGQKLFLTTNNEIINGRRGNLDIYIKERTKDGWSENINIGDGVNTELREDWHSVTSDGTLYYSGYIRNESEKPRLFILKSEFKNGKYQSAEKLPDVINSNDVDTCPFIAPDESYLIFGSFRKGNKGKGDLYISFRTSADSWTAPKNLGSKINTQYKEGYPYVSLDGKYLFFMSNRISEINENRVPRGLGNVFWVDAKIIDDLRPADIKK